MSESPRSGAAEYRCGWVALAGPPNAGKSTLLNALLGQKVTIVTPKPQTTRNQIVGIFTDAEAQIIFMDTPGMAQLRGRLSKTMIQAVWQSLNQADVALGESIAGDERPTIIVPNKVDLFADKSRMLPLLTRAHELWPRAEIFPVSAQSGVGRVELRTLIESRLPVGPAQFPEDQVSTASLRFMAAEIIREKLFLYLHQEVPYGVAVEVESWQEDPERGLTVIHAVIYVARPMYKARREIRELVDGKVHLELWVKVRENWTEDEAFLRELEQSSGGSGE